MRYCSLSSSSHGGNAYLVEGGDGTRVLFDCGVSIRRLETYLAEVGVLPDSLSALFMTHDHADHVAALRVKRTFPVKYPLPVYASGGFWTAWDRLWRPESVPATLRRLAENRRPIRVDGLRITPFTKPHDAPEPVSYLVDDGTEQLVILTDAGHVPAELTALLQGRHHYIFESNHDREMEMRSGRAPYLITRVLGQLGHLSNDQAAAALSTLISAATRSILLAHLSRDCNRPELAHQVVASALAPGGYRGDLAVAPATQPSPWYPTAVAAGQQLRLSGL